MISRTARFEVPELCNVSALILLVLTGQLLVLVLLFAGGQVTWLRFGLLSLFVQWVAIMSAALLCWLRPWLSQCSQIVGGLLAFSLVLVITLLVGTGADRLLGDTLTIRWGTIGGELLISGIITGLALRYFYVQQRLRVQEQSELQSRLQALQSRIRPHFLFNSMNIIASLIGTDPETAESVVEDLSELFRASLNETGNQVAFADELELCKRYVRIEALRLGDRLEVNWELPDIPPGVKIPLLTLQPLLENAIYHGIQPRPEGGDIQVSVKFEQGKVQVQIDNPLPPADSRRESQGNRMALDNIQSRLKVLHGQLAGLTAGEQDGRFVTRLHYPMDGPELVSAVEVP